MAVDKFFLSYPPIIQKLMDDEQDDPSFKEITDYNSQYKQVLVTDHIKLFGYMLFLIRKELRLTQSDMGVLLKNFGVGSQRHGIGLSKSGYSKIENGITHLDFEIVFILSDRLDVDFHIIFELYYKIIMLAYNKDCYFMQPCGNLNHGKGLSFFHNLTETSNEYWYTDLKQYKNYFNDFDLVEIKELLNKVLINRETIKTKLNYQKQMRERSLKRRRFQKEKKIKSS